MNTDFFKLDEMYSTLKDLFPSAEIWSCVTVFSRTNTIGSIYPQVPFKNKPFEYFLEVDKICDSYRPIEGVRVVSHGLWHINHAKADRQLQEASIVTSCNLLNTSVFVPPFNAWNADTDEICKQHDIELIKYEDGWKSIEHNDFNPNHDLWYMHSWMWELPKLVDYFRS